MNCKQGDLAIVVHSWAGNEGKIVRCLRLKVSAWRDLGDKEYVLPTWEVDVMLVNLEGVKGKDIADFQLRPIRDPGDDATDETLTWLPVPHKEIS